MGHQNPDAKTFKTFTYTFIVTWSPTVKLVVKSRLNFMREKSKNGYFGNAKLLAKCLKLKLSRGVLRGGIILKQVTTFIPRRRPRLDPRSPE
jgi:hypothetical protein